MSNEPSIRDDDDEGVVLVSGDDVAAADAVERVTHDDAKVKSSNSGTGGKKNDDDQHHCLVCYSDLRKRNVCHTIAPCDHNEICALCHLRLRHLHSDKRCPICKTAHEQVVCDYRMEKTFEEYPIWGEDLGADYFYRSDVGMFFPTKFYNETVKPLFGFHCTIQHCDFDGTPESIEQEEQQQQQETNNAEEGNNNNNNNNNNNKNSKKQSNPVRNLQDHLRARHRLALCQLCVDHKRDFVARLPRFSPAALKKHLSQGDGNSSAFKGHPLCEFCKPKRFYDLTELHQHLQKEHYKCHVCEQAHGLQNQYYSTYRSLERHFDTQHFLCHDVQCLSARFVVFSNEIDLRHHERQVHGATSSGNTKIQLQFRVRRSGAPENQQTPDESDFNYGLDGQAFVPAALPSQRRQQAGATQQQPNEDQLHPLHLQRTEELRQQAANLRLQQEEANAFPSLAETNAVGSGATSTGRLTMGWTSSENAAATISRATKRQAQAGRVTEEDFPSLAPAPTAKKTISAIQKAGNQKPVRSGATAAGGWASHVSSTSAPSQSLGGRTAASAVVSRNVNNTANLAAENFPSLGLPGNASRAAITSAPRYGAAGALANKNVQQKATPSMTADQFPSLSSTTPAPQKRMTAASLGAKKPPPMDSVADFPTPQATIVAAEVSVEELKASLGPTKFKTLKRYTKDFANGNITEEEYIEEAATLFDNGFENVDFWKFVPSLIESSPARAATKYQARKYMENIQKSNPNAQAAQTIAAQELSTMQQQKQPPKMKAAAELYPNAVQVQKQKQAAATSQWNSVSTSNKIKAAPPAQVAAAPVAGMRYAPPPPPQNTAIFKAPSSKNASAWGAGGSAPTAQRLKNPPSLAAKAGKPQNQSATKFMAKEEKDTKWQQAAGGSSNKNKKKSKQKNELRNLAYGS